MSVAASPDSRNVSRKAVRRLDAATAAPFVIFLIVYALVPRFAADKELTMLIYIGINTMLAISLNLLMGYAGQVSLGHAAFFGLGAYASALLTMQTGAPVWLGFVFAGLLAGLTQGHHRLAELGLQLGVPPAGRGQILLRIENVESGALSALRFTANAL